LQNLQDIKDKKDQFLRDMQMGLENRQAHLQRQRELEAYEEQMLRQYATNQASRTAHLNDMKAAAEQQRDLIF